MEYVFRHHKASLLRTATVDMSTAFLSDDMDEFVSPHETLSLCFIIISI